MSENRPLQASSAGLAHEVVVLAGDGIGPEVTGAAVRVLRAATDLVGSTPLRFTHRDVGFAHFEQSGEALPDEVITTARAADAVLVGAIDVARFPAGVVDSLSALRRGLQAGVSVRPARSLPGVEVPVGPIDTVVVREVTEGLYSGVEYDVGGGAACAVRVITAEASLRAARVAFDQASRRRSRVTVIHKRGVLPRTDGIFLEAAAEVARSYPGVELQTANVDACAMELIREPEEFDVILSTNAFGDILSDVAAALAGGLGLAASGCIGEHHSYFEPIHGTAPDIAGKGVANPVATILSAALMLRHLGEVTAADCVEAGVEAVLAAGAVRTGDLGGRATCEEMTDAVLDALVVGEPGSSS